MLGLEVFGLPSRRPGPWYPRECWDLKSRPPSLLRRDLLGALGFPEGSATGAHAQCLPSLPLCGFGGVVREHGGLGAHLPSAAAASRPPSAVLGAAGARPSAGFLWGPEPALG